MTIMREQIEAIYNVTVITEDGAFAPDADVANEVKRLALSALDQVWQPIETAPKDDRDVLLTNGGDVHCGFLCGGAWSDPTGQRLYPTHWMPLPAPALRAEVGHGEG